MSRTPGARVSHEYGTRKLLGARVSYRKFYGKGNDADRCSDRDFVTFSLTRHSWRPGFAAGLLLR